MTRHDGPAGEPFPAALLSTLAGEPNEASSIDLARAIVAGRRRRRVRRAAQFTAATVVAVAALAGAATAVTGLDRSADPDAPAGATPTPRPSATASPAPAACVPSELQMPRQDGEETTVSAGDPTGHWHVGRFRAADGDSKFAMVVWKDGQIVGNPELDGANQVLHDINSTGLAVGEGFYVDHPTPYAVLAGGAVQQLPGIERGTALAVNASGVIVGSRQAGGELSVPVVWPSVTGNPVDLPLPAGHRSGQAVGVDDDGTVIGALDTGTGAQRAYMWRADDTGELLKNPTVGGQVAESFEPTDIRGGWVVGTARLARSSTPLPFRYHLATGTYQQLVAGAGGVRAVNANGWAVGRVTAGQQATLYTGAAPVPLAADLFDAPRTDTDAVAISDDGRTIAGFGTTRGGQPRPARWTCR